VSVTIGKSVSEAVLEPGQFIFGRHSNARELGVKESTLYKQMQKLVKLGEIVIKSNNHFSIVTVCQWAESQCLIKQSESPNRQIVTTAELPDNTNDNEENDKNEKEISNTAKHLLLHRPRRENLSWLRPYAEKWKEIMGGEIPAGEATKYLHKLHREHGQEKVLCHLENYLRSLNDPKFVSLSRFASTFGTWTEMNANDWKRRAKQILRANYYADGF